MNVPFSPPSTIFYRKMFTCKTNYNKKYSRKINKAELFNDPTHFSVLSLL